MSTVRAALRRSFPARTPSAGRRSADLSSTDLRSTSAMPRAAAPERRTPAAARGFRTLAAAPERSRLAAARPRRAPRLLRLAALAALAGIALSACAPSAKVGAGVKLGANNGAANLNLGGTSTAHPKPKPTPTHTAVVTQPTPVHTQAAAPVSQPTQAAPTQAAPTQTAAPVNRTFHVTINSNTSGKPGFDPADVAVYVGTTIVFTNDGTKPHSVVAEGGAFHSPLIPVGGSWSWLANRPGTYDIQDGTRPYVTGEIQVYAS